MTVVYDTQGAPVEIAPGRGDLRKSSVPYSMQKSPGSLAMIGRYPVSYGDLFATQPWIAAAVMRMLTWAVRVPLKCYRRESDDSRVQLRHDEHPLARMIRRPWMGNEGGAVASQSRLMQCLLGPVLVHGNTVIEIEHRGGEDWLVPLDWRDVTPLGTTSGDELVGWRVNEGGQDRDVAAAKALHLGWWSPMGPLGVSPLQQLGTTLAIEDAAQRYQTSMLGRGARPPSAIETSVEFVSMDREERQAMLNQLREDVTDIYAGPDQAGKPALLPPGLTWNQVGHTAVEAELIDQRRVAREEVAAVYQIPPPMMGILDNATYSNIETQKEMSYTDCLGPPLVLIEQTITNVIARDLYGEDDVYVEFDFGPVLRGDRAKEIAAFRTGIQTGIYSPNEARRALNLKPEEHEDADKLWMPVNNLAPMGEKPAAQEAQEAKEAEEAAAEEAKPAEEAAEPEKEEQPREEAATARPLATEADADFEEGEHPRDNKGRFRKKDAPDVPDAPTVSPSEEDASGLPELPWEDPPPPIGKKGERTTTGGYSSDKAFGTNTKLGRIGEKAFVELLGGEILHPEGHGEQSPLDVRVGDYGVEVKGVARRSTSYKATPKKHEIAEKEEAAEEMGVRPALAIVVMDAEAKTAHVYWREGLATGRLSKNTGWKFAGKTDLPDNASVAWVFRRLFGIEADAEFREQDHPRDSDGKFRRRNRPGDAGLTETERIRGLQALGDYGGTDWNWALRDRRCGEGSAFGNCKGNTPKLDRYIEGQPDVPAGTEFWRGVAVGEDYTAEYEDEPPITFDPRTLKVGDVISDDGFLSVSEDRKLAERFAESSLAHGGFRGVLLHVKVKNPQPAADVMDSIDYQNEEFGLFDSEEDAEAYKWSEMVFARESKMKVVEVHEEEIAGEPMNVLEVELV